MNTFTKEFFIKWEGRANSAQPEFCFKDKTSSVFLSHSELSGFDFSDKGVHGAAQSKFLKGTVINSMKSGHLAAENNTDPDIDMDKVMAVLRMLEDGEFYPDFEQIAGIFIARHTLH